jgi:hypothetical protein
MDYKLECERLKKELKDLNESFQEFQDTSMEVEAELELSLKEV